MKLLKRGLLNSAGRVHLFVALVLGSGQALGADSYWLDSSNNKAGTRYATGEAACLTGELQRRVDAYVAASPLPHRYASPYFGDLGTGEGICRGQIQKQQFGLWLPVEVVDTLIYGPFQEQPACRSGEAVDPFTEQCVLPEPDGGPSCKRPSIDGMLSGHPIVPATAEKYRREIDWSDSGPAPLSLVRIYRSSWSANASYPTAGLGEVWNHNHVLRMSIARSSGIPAVNIPANAPIAVSITSSEGYTRSFAKNFDTNSWTSANSSDTLAEVGGAWVYRRGDDDAVLTFTADGRLQTRVDRGGFAYAYTYDAAARLASVGNSFGRVLRFTYNVTGQLSLVTTPDGRSIGYGYDAAGRLAAVTYPDGKSRQFLYENNTYPQALTGIVDEAGQRWGTFGYDSQGRAISTELAGAADRYQVSYPSSGSATITDPLGTSRSYSYGTTKGKLAVTGGSLPSGEGEADARSRVQDANGLVTSETDFNGARIDYVWDAARRLPTSVTRAAGTPEAVTVTTQWHPTFSLPTLVAESGRTTAYTYDDRGNALSQTVTDTGASKAQTWQWTYTAQSLVSTQTEPNGAVTRHEYDPLGNLVKTTNALGHVTQYAYDTANRVISHTAPNGLVTTYTYDARDRVLTRTVGGQLTTTLTYKPFGKVESITLPTGLALTYIYDAAHRLTGWTNNRGESGTFTLDGMGNRISEQIKDSRGAIAWSVVRTVNNINRLYSKTEGSNQISVFGYDANGELTSETNGLNQSTRYGLDGLRRVQSITDAANATATLAWNALDAITQANDFKGVATTYNRDADGNATAETGADIGSRGTQYDALGLPSTIVDALGQATRIERDLLGRPTSLTFADGKTTTLRYDLTPSSVGYLSEIRDRSGLTMYTRDVFGRVASKYQVLAGGHSSQVHYTYDAKGLLRSIAHPTLLSVDYEYDATGRPVQISWAGVPVVTGITWNPLGQPTGWTWSFTNPQAATRTYDTAGRLTATEFSGYAYDAAGRITSLSQYLYQAADNDPWSTSVVAALRGWNVSYDAAGRITGFDEMGATGNTASFTYDANGNRASSTRTENGQTTSRSYVVDGASNRLNGFSQTSGSTTTRVTYAHNANGDLTGDGLRAYSYDPEGRLAAVTTGAGEFSPTTKYAHNALGQRVFKTEPLYPPGSSQEDASEPGVWQSVVSFFTDLWQPQDNGAERLGMAYLYDEEGSLISEMGMGGANSSISSTHIYLPTASGPMPIAVEIQGQRYAVHSDHLNTPRLLTNQDGVPMWQWAYSAFGDNAPQNAWNRFYPAGEGSSPGSMLAYRNVVYNLRYPGQYFDLESGLHYNYFRSYRAADGTYTQNDPKGLAAGWNRRPYALNNPLRYTDPYGLNPLAGAIGGAEIGAAFGPPGMVVGGVIGAGVGAWIGWNVVGPMARPDPMLSSGLPPGFWPADKGAAEWGRRNGMGQREGKGRFHGIKQGCGGRATDNFGVDPETGEVIDPEGESVGNLWDAKPK